MATVAYTAPTRRKITARPRPEVDLKDVLKDVNERYKNTLEYLAR